ncbi:Uncharacterised protein [Aeromonas hydrophila]|nr:Uncharacterised protein [Aeromonas hydrophila]
MCLRLPAGLATTHGRTLAQMDLTDVRLTLPECLARHPECATNDSENASCCACGKVLFRSRVIL